MINYFLLNTLKDITSRQISNFCILVPNNQIKNILSDDYHIYTLDEIVTYNRKTLSQFDIILRLFHIYKNNIKDIDFNNFWNIGNILSQDFDTIDRCCIKSDDLFNNIIEYKKYSLSFEELPEDQKKIILSFWNVFNSNKYKKESSLKFFDNIHQLYDSFKKSLNNEWYLGLCYRNFDIKLIQPYDNVIFIGMNHLHQSDQQLINYINKHKNTFFYLDIDEYYYNNPKHEINKILLDYKSCNICLQITNNIADVSIKVLKCNSDTEQVTSCINIIHSIPKDCDIAIIITDINILPQFILMIDFPINSSLDYPIKITHFYNFLISEIRQDLKINELMEIVETYIPQNNYDLLVINEFLKYLISLSEINIEIKDTKNFVKKAFQSIHIPFESNSNSNIHVMLFSDTINLSFDHVFIIGANDDNLPLKYSYCSFIPYNLRKGFNLPTNESHIYAYYFYRLLHNTKNLFIIYNQQQGEITRYITQLKYESDIKIETISNKYHINSSFRKSDVIIDKKEYISNLQFFHDKITPTFINTYLDCQIRFFYKYVKRIKESTSQEASFGTNIHYILKNIYDLEQTIDKKSIELIKQKAIKLIDKIFMINNDFNKVLEKNIATKMIINFLEYESQYNDSCQIISLEHSINSYKIDKYSINGIIDRVDKINNKFRVIDYKTCQTSNNIKNISELFDRDKNRINSSKILQILMYSMTIENSIPMIISLRDINKDHSVKINNKSINMTSDVISELKDCLLFVLNEIFDPNIKFKNTNNEKNCTFCPYVVFCKHKTIK